MTDAYPQTDRFQRLLDHRGTEYQRLEFVGDSVLDVLTTRRLLTTDHWKHRNVGDLVQRRQRLVSDRSLAKAADRADLPRTGPGWRHRADLVEALIGIGWAEGGWDRAATIADALVLGGLPAGPTPRRKQLRPTRPNARRIRWLGEAVTEAAASIVGYDVVDGDESDMHDFRSARASHRQLGPAMRRSGIATNSRADLAVRQGRLHLGLTALTIDIPSAVEAAEPLFR